jgi:hypothetical protein
MLVAGNKSPEPKVKDDVIITLFLMGEAIYIFMIETDIERGTTIP